MELQRFENYDENITKFKGEMQIKFI